MNRLVSIKGLIQVIPPRAWKNGFSVSVYFQIGTYFGSVVCAVDLDSDE